MTSDPSSRMGSGKLRSVRARTTLVATAVVAIVLIAAVAALANAVERTLVRRVLDQGEQEVEEVIERLAGGATPERALQPSRPTDVVGDDAIPTFVAILDHEGHPVVGSGFFDIPGVDEVSVGEISGGAHDDQARTVDGGVDEVSVGEISGGDSSGPAPDQEPRVVRVGESDLAIAQRSIEVDGQLLLVVAASPLAEVIRSVDTIIRTSWVGVPLLIVLVGAVTWIATGRTLRPIEGIRTEVEQLSSQTLDRRVPVPDTGDEVARLAQTMNGMLARLEAASTRQHEFVSDASHELRSPVASIRAELEVALAHPEASNWRDVATGALSETSRIERIVDNLLLLARLDEGAASAIETVDIGGLVAEVAGRVVGVAVDAHIADGLLVRGRDAELASVIRNLFDNAVRHAISTVAVAATAHDGTVVITVDDDGPGIPPADRDRVFQRFTRLEQARSRAGGGVGLGLAVVDRVVRYHNGSVTVSDSPAGGARFEVVLPAAL